MSACYYKAGIRGGCMGWFIAVTISRMRYWYAHFDHDAPRDSRRRKQVEFVDTAPPTWKVPSVAAPNVGDRLFFKRLGPALGSTRPACLGLAEVMSVGPDANGFAEIGFRTVMPAIAFINRGVRRFLREARLASRLDHS